MEQRTMNVHFETFDDASFDRLVGLADNNPIAISISPWQIPQIKKNHVLKLMDIFSNDGNILGQQGLNHKCSKCKDYHYDDNRAENGKRGIDPWHENYCLWFGEINYDDQWKFMVEGRNTLREAFGKMSELYVPPNHLMGKNTIDAAGNIGYTWISDRALLKIEPYRSGKIIIVPEGEPIIENSSTYIHADRWKGKLDRIIEKGYTSFHALTPTNVSENKLLINRKLKMMGKIRRDLQKGYDVTPETGQAIAEMLYANISQRGEFA